MNDLPMSQQLSVDGVPISREDRPTSAAAVAELLSAADREGVAVIPVGGGTKLALGNPPDRADIAVRLDGLDRVLHYEPTDMTLSVEAGARFAAVQEVLAIQGQELPLEVADASEATIGGLIATALSGPRRLGSGTLRDLLIGINVAYPSGILGKAGGLVVKNVTGFDMMRLHLGALGTIGVIVSANFKVLPRPRAEATVLSSPESLDRALELSESLRLTRVQPTAVEIIERDGGWTCAIRVMGRADTVRMLGDEVLKVAGSGAILTESESREFWTRLVSSQTLRGDGTSTLVRLTGRPSETADLARAALAVGERSSFSSSDWMIGPGLGTVTCRLTSTAANPAPSLNAWQQEALAIAAHVTILSAPDGWKTEVDVWGREPEPAGVMRSVKQEFDPNRVLNPGRFAGRL